MKKLSIVLWIITVVACKKTANNSNPTAPNSLNAEEKKILGTWHLKKEHRVEAGLKDTTYTSFAGAAYVKFTDVAFPDWSAIMANPKRFTDNAMLHSIAIDIQKVRGTKSYDLPWRIDPTSNYLVVGESARNYQLVVLTASELIVKSVVGNSNVKDTLFFERQ